MLKEHDIVRLKCDYAGVASGSEGTVVHTYSSVEEEVEVEFQGRGVIAVLARFLDIICTPNAEVRHSLPQ